MKDFYPEIEPYDHFFLAVGQSHQVYVEQCGNPNGQPVLFIHGGPGGGCSENDRRFFDPDQYRIILFDQRGCGRSLPHGLLTDNTTQHLILDMERLREHLEIDHWHLFGGSWGSTLALAYAQANASVVSSLVLRGIFLSRPKDIHWTFGGGGASRIFPDHWSEFVDAFPESDDDNYVQQGYRLMTGEDKELAKKIAKAWTRWELSCCTLKPNKEFLASNLSDEHCWTLARHEAHYMMNQCFLKENQLLDQCHKIQNIPTTIVHGRYDIVCPFDNALALKTALPHAKLTIAEDSGHASMEESTRSLLIEATEQMLTI